MIRAVRDIRSAIRAGIRLDSDMYLIFLISLEIHAVIHLLQLEKLPKIAISRNIDIVYG
jgi:hypothetical protein